MVEHAAVAEIKESRVYRLRWWTLMVIALCVIIVSLNGTMMNVALPTIQSKLNATSSQLQWMMNIYTLIMGGLVLTCGTLSDRLGRAKSLRVGLAIFGLSSFGAAFSTMASHVILARAFMGVGMAIIQPCALSIITNSFPKEERGLAIGVWAGLTGVGLALGPILGGTIVQNLDWGWIFLINVPIVVLAFVLSLFLVPDNRDANPRRLDIPGNALFLAGIASLMYGLNNASLSGWTAPVVLATIIGSVAILLLFVLWERRTPDPLLDMSFFKNVRFSTSLTFLAINGICMLTIMYLVTFYMQFVKGYTAFQTGMRYLPFAIGMLLGSVISDRLTNRMGFKVITSIGFLGSASISAVAAFFKVGTPFWQFGMMLFFLSFFLGCIAAPTANVLMGSLPKAKAGISSALNSIAIYVPGSIGIAALGSILTSIYSNHFLKVAVSIQGLPATLADKASNSIGTALGIVNSGKIPAAIADPLISTARQSFMDGWKVVALILCGIFVLGVAICLKFTPSHTVITEEAQSEKGIELHIHTHSEQEPDE